MTPTTNHRNAPVGRWSICLLLAFAVSACTPHSEAMDEVPDAAPLHIGSASMSSGLSTYAADEADRTLTANGDQMGLFLQEQSGEYSAVSNRLFAYATPYWQTDEQLLLTTTSATLAAYYPYTAAHGQNPILMRSGAYTTADDLSYTAFSASRTTPYANLTLNHAYARLQFNFSPDADYADPGVITHVNIAGQGIRSVARLDLFQANGVEGSIVDVPGVQPSVDIPLTNISFSNNNPKKAVTDFLMIPGTLAGDITFIATIDGRIMQGVVSATALCGAGGKLLYGKVYQVNVTVKPNVLVIGQVTIAGWESTPVNNGNGVETMPDADDIPPYVILSSINLRVAKGNLMRAGATGAWFLAPDQGYYTGDARGGDYFRWGITDPSSVGGSNGTNMNGLTAGCVAVLGAGWRVPTNAENKALANVADKFFGTYKSERSDSKGYYFGIGKQPDFDNQDNYVFLPAAGYRSYDSKMYNVVGGDYWSSDYNGDGGAYNLDFNSNNINGAGTTTRSYGLSVRCVASL